MKTRNEHIERTRCSLVYLGLSALLAACGKPTPSQLAAPSGNPDAPPANGEFIDHVWISTTPGAAHGSFVLFLADRTMLMGSCTEPYRLSQWGVAGEAIRWIEDKIPIEADVAMPRRGQMSLQFAGQDRVQTFVLASAPYVCPLPR